MKIAIVDDEEKYLDRIEKSVGDFKKTNRSKYPGTHPERFC